jgi:serine/threonine protein kinase
MLANECPTRNELRQLATGIASDLLADQLDEHVAECATCREVLLALEHEAGAGLLELAAAGKLVSPSEAQRASVQSILAALGTMEPPFPPRCKSVAMGTPSHLAGYQLEFLIASGGMGQVWRAKDQRLERVVAIKQLHQISPKSQARFIREMQAVASLDHPNIVRAYHADESQGSPFLVMEFVAGANVSVVERTCRPLAVADACELTRQMAVGAAYVHEQGGIIHRDIKPANAMLSIDGTVKLLDLGLAAFLNREDEFVELTTAGNVLGTLDYMSPEQLAGKTDVDQRTDIYSLGATLYRLLCGHAPYRNIGSLLDRLQAMQNGDFTSVIDLRDDVPAELAAIVNRALATDPTQRFSQASELAAALEPFAEASNLEALSKSVRTKFEQADTAEYVRPQLSTKHPTGSGVFFGQAVRHDENGSAEKDSRPPRRQRSPSRRSWIILTALLVCGASVTALQCSPHAPHDEPTIASRESRVESSEPAKSSSPSLNSQPSTLNFRLSTLNSQPPTLDDWLHDRELITVAQDGTAMFTTIQAAIDALKPGQAVEVLDHGPYRESIKCIGPPQDTGLFARVDCVIIAVAPFQIPFSSEPVGHTFSGTDGFRLSGFTFRNTATDEHARVDGHRLVDCRAHRGLFVVEDCSVRNDLSQWRNASRGYNSAISLMCSQRTNARLWMRNCFVFGRASTWTTDTVQAVFERNWFTSGVGDAVGVFGRGGVAVIRENVIHGFNGIGVVIGQPGDPTPERTYLIHNTIACRDFALDIKSPASLTMQGNLFAGVRHVSEQPELTIPTVLANWIVDRNMIAIARSNGQELPVDPSECLATPNFLSQSSADEDYLRIPTPTYVTDKRPQPFDAAAHDFIGALPYGPAPVEGDWFTKLLDRWNSVSQKEQP